MGIEMLITCTVPSNDIILFSMGLHVSFLKEPIKPSGELSALQTGSDIRDYKGQHKGFLYNCACFD